MSRRLLAPSPWTRRLSAAVAAPPELRSAADLPPRTVPRYLQSTRPGSSLLSLQWPAPPRNLLLVQKLYAPDVTDAVVQFAGHVRDQYPAVNMVVEPRVADMLGGRLGSPVYVSDSAARVADKIDVIATFGGDGTVLRAASLFKLHGSVPPILSFRMGNLGFLGEWDICEHQRAWREMYWSGSAPGEGRAAAAAAASKVLLRHRIKADVVDAQGANVNARLSDSLVSQASSGIASGSEAAPSLRAINEISVHRGSHPHLAVIDVFQNGHFLTETTADGILVSTPTGSTAYSLSAGGPIVHPLVKSLLITSISPCSLSFRSLVLPLDTRVMLRMSSKNRGRELDLSIDGRRCAGVSPGSEIHIEGEFVGRAGPGEEWHGGVPCVVRAKDNDPWVGGLNGLLKFNHPFGRDAVDD